MKPKIVLAGICIWTVAALLTTVLLSRKLHNAAPVTRVKTFQVHGKVLGIDAATKSIRIAHEAISNYMPAMTMPFFVKETSMLAGMAVGETVQFELSVTENDSWISHIEKIPPEKPLGSGYGPVQSPEQSSEIVNISF